jgi:diguanylate cyclase (GGDEF)-like protein/PAS domain S-box-containing protein
MAMERSRRLLAGRVFIITRNPRDARAIQESLAGLGHDPFDVEWVSSLTDSLDRLNRLSVGAIILDLSLSDSQGIETFDKVSEAAPGVPILVLSTTEEEELAKQAVQRGAHDYLPKDRLDSYSLPRAVRTLITVKIATEIVVGDRQRAEATLNSIGDAVLSTDIEGKITYLNAVAEKMIGWKLEEAFGRPLDEVFDLVDRETREPACNPLAFAIQQDQTVGLSADCLLIRRDGVEIAIEDSAAPVRDHERRVIGAVLVFRDVGKAHALAHKMSQLAQHDFLTELPNRLLLNDRLSQAIRMDERHRKKLAVLFVDLDQFKSINDSLGHAIGDALLQAVAKHLRETISRHGGDEFIILLPEIDRADDAAQVADKVLARLAEPHTIEGRKLYVTASIGISIYPDHGLNAEVLIHYADLAMYEAKKRGGRQRCFYAPKHHTPAGNNHG